MLLYSILFEADIRQVNPATKGLYAFVNAYSRLVGPIFRKPLYIEFDPKNTKPILSGRTLYLSPHLKDISCSVGACHDMLHGITQNIIETFSKYRELNPELKNLATSNALHRYSDDKILLNQNNQQKFTLKGYAKVVDAIKERGRKVPSFYDVSEVIKDIPYEIKQLSKLDRELALTKFLKDKLFDLSSRLGMTVYSSPDTDYFRSISKLDLGSSYLGDKEDNLTHRIEEDVGNFISDGFSQYIEFSDLADSDKIMSEFQNLINRRIDYVAGKLSYKRKEVVLQNLLKWKEYMEKVVPPLVKEYNKQLSILNRSGYGKDYDESRVF